MSNLFNGKNQKKNSKFRLLKILPSMLSVKQPEFIYLEKRKAIFVDKVLPMNTVRSLFIKYNIYLFCVTFVKKAFSRVP